MAVKTYEVKIGSTELSLKSYEVIRRKKWSEMKENMKGELKAVFKGDFAELRLEFPYLSESDLKTVLGLLESDIISVSWWDSKAEDYKTGNFYPSSFSVPYYSRETELYAPFKITLNAYTSL